MVVEVWRKGTKVVVGVGWRKGVEMGLTLFALGG